MGKGSRLWNKNFTILWQGQLISDLGNGIFTAILSLWVLDLTQNNKIIMGTVLACLTLPRVILGPFVGAFADRQSRKWIIVTADTIRGIMFTGLGILALALAHRLDFFPVSVLYPVAIISGICSAFFSPAIISSIPDIVPADKLTKANSLRTFSQSAGGFIGLASGTGLYTLFGAGPLVFAYGLCFVYAAITQLFMHIPNTRKNGDGKHIFSEMMEGMKYTFGQNGIRTLIILGMFLNFFANMGITLLAPLFIEEPSFGKAILGPVMATMMIGQLVGMLIISVLKLKPKDRPKVFYLSVAVLIGGMIPVGLVKIVYLMFPLALVIGASVSIMTILMYTLLQITVAPESRGKVFGIMSTVFEGLTPVAQSSSGFVSQLLEPNGVRKTIVSAFGCAAIVLGFAFFNKPFKAFLKSEPKYEDGAKMELPHL